MLSSISDNTFLNMFLKRELNTFKSPRNKLDTNTSQSKDKLSTIPINLLKLKRLPAHKLQEDMSKEPLTQPLLKLEDTSQAHKPQDTFQVLKLEDTLVEDKPPTLLVDKLEGMFLEVKQENT